MKKRRVLNDLPFATSFPSTVDTGRNNISDRNNSETMTERHSESIERYLEALGWLSIGTIRDPQTPKLRVEILARIAMLIAE